jgi:predicted RNase H-like nuclease (RuvC/YqgF family)
MSGNVYSQTLEEANFVSGQGLYASTRLKNAILEVCSAVGGDVGKRNEILATGWRELRALKTAHEKNVKHWNEGMLKLREGEGKLQEELAALEREREVLQEREGKVAERERAVNDGREGLKELEKNLSVEKCRLETLDEELKCMFYSFLSHFYLIVNIGQVYKII